SSGSWTYDDTAGEIFGIEPVQQSNWKSAICDDYDLVMSALARCIETRKATDVELRVKQADGSCHWVQVLAQAIEVPGGGVCLAGISMDVSDRKRAEEAVRESERQLRAIVDSLPGVAYRCSIEPPWTM